MKKPQQQHRPVVLATQAPAHRSTIFSKRNNIAKSILTLHTARQERESGGAWFFNHKAGIQNPKSPHFRPAKYHHHWFPLTTRRSARATCMTMWCFANAGSPSLETPAKLLATLICEKIIVAFRVPAETGSDFF
jgi:hypothetical protein